MADAPLKSRRWFRFSLRFLMLLVVVIGLPLAWKVNRVRNQRLVVAEIERLGGHMFYDYERNFNVGISTGSAPELPGPNWLRHILGDDFFADVVHVNVHGPQVTDDTLARLASLPNLQLLGADSDKITDNGVAIVAKSKQLISFEVTSKNVTTAGIDHLQGLPKLVFLRCSGAQVDDSWIPHVAKLNALRNLVLRDTRVTDKGLAGLANMKKLAGLFFENTPITDAGLDQLHGFTNLERLGLHQTQVTSDGLKRFKAALPNSQIRQY